EAHRPSGPGDALRRREGGVVAEDAPGRLVGAGEVEAAVVLRPADRAVRTELRVHRVGIAHQGFGIVVERLGPEPWRRVRHRRPPSSSWPAFGREDAGISKRWETEPAGEWKRRLESETIGS